MNLLILFVHFVDFKGGLGIWKFDNYSTFQGSIWHLAKAIALLCAFLLAPELRQTVSLHENQLFITCRAMEILNNEGTEVVFSRDRFVSLVCGWDFSSPAQVRCRPPVLKLVEAQIFSNRPCTQLLLYTECCPMQFWIPYWTYVCCDTRNITVWRCIQKWMLDRRLANFIAFGGVAPL